MASATSDHAVWEGGKKVTKILLALAILGSGGGAFLVARQSTTLLRHEANASREACLLQTQLVAVAQNDQAALIIRVRELKEALAQVPAATENPLWLALQTNHVGHLAPELLERLFEELGFNWKSSQDFIVVSKETIHNIQMGAIQDGKLTEIATSVLALTPRERSQVEAAMQRVQIDFNDWARAHTERSEPKDDVVAQYTLHNDPSLSVSNHFAAGLHEAVGRERAELILISAPDYFISDIGIRHGDKSILNLKRYLIGNEARYTFQVLDTYGNQQQWPMSRPREVSRDAWFPPTFRPIFPNGWSDVAQREGFDLPPEESQGK
jgi:hypothetical protein